MADIAQVVLFILACASLFGLGAYLFRDQIWPEEFKAKGDIVKQSRPKVVLSKPSPPLAAQRWYLPRGGQGLTLSGAGRRRFFGMRTRLRAAAI
jgi:hypothetical protein